MAAIHTEATRIRPTLLLAEDHMEVAAAVIGVLRHHFDVLEVVPDGQMLIERVDQLRPDVIVTDVGLKTLNGLAATLAIRQRHPSIPIVVLTANRDPDICSAALAAGASAFLLKDEAANALVAVLQSLLRQANGT